MRDRIPVSTGALRTLVVGGFLWPFTATIHATPPAAPVATPFDREVADRRADFAAAGGRVQAISPLLDLLDLWDRVDDRAAIGRFLDEASTSEPALPLVRARARYLRAIALDRLGRPGEASEARKSLGFLTAGWVCGPFDNEGKIGHTTLYEPERELRSGKPFDPRASYQGKERRVGWRELPPVAVAGQVSLDSVLRPDTSVTAYVTLAVRSPRAERAALRVGSSAAIKIWVNGRLELERDVYRPVRFDQDAAPAELAAGWNQITLKLSGAGGGMRYFLRLTRPDGAELDGLTVSASPGDLASASPGSAAEPRGRWFAVADLGRSLEALASAHPRDAALRGLLGRYLRAVSPDDPEKHRAQEVLAEAAQLGPTARAYSELETAEPDANEQRKALDEGLALTAQNPSDRARLYAAFGELWTRARRPRRAEEMWRAALAADASLYPAQIALAELAADRGLPSLAAAELAAVERAHPTLKVLRAEASLALRRGRRAEAQAFLERLLAGQRDDEDALTELFAQARGRGAVDEALHWLDLLDRARPDLLSIAVDRADLLAGIGRYAEAERRMRAALEVAPDDARLLEKDGRLLHRLGREPLAIEKLRRSLELHPQNPELRAYVNELVARGSPAGAKAAQDLAAAWAVDVPSLIARMKSQPPSGAQAARVLYAQEVTRVHANGLSETFQQRVVEILDEQGAREQGDFDIRYTPDSQFVEVRAARVHKADGEVLEAVSTEEQSLSDPSYGLYYDVRAQVIRFSGLSPGDVIDLEYVLADVARRNLFGDYFGDMHFFQEEMPRVEERYVLIAPSARVLYFNEPRPVGALPDAKVERSDERVGDERVYTFRAKNAAKAPSEPGMPGFSETASYLHVSTYRNWRDVAVWYQGLIKDQLDPSPAIVQAVKQATRGITDERAKIRAIYDLVVRRTRYVALEFGIHGYQPYRVSQVFSRKFGDCKDKASLLLVMLKQIGVDATLVLARTRPGGDLDAVPASLAPFDHAIAYLPKYDLFLDGTAEFSGSAELPAQDQDIPVLLVNTGTLRRTPVLPAAKNRVASDWRVRLEADGAAAVDETITVAGEAAHEWRSHYQAGGERNERYERAWNGKHPGAKLVKLEMSVDDLERPVSARARLVVPRWARPLGSDRLGMPALGRDPDMLRSFARLSSRKLDLILGYPWRQEERIRLRPPAGFRVERLPEARTLAAPFGTFSLAAALEDGEIRVAATLEVSRHRIARGDYEAFRRFCADVDAAVAQEIVLASVKVTAR